MLPENLDFIFPFFVLAYGAIMTFVLNIPLLSELAEQRLPYNVVRQINAHRGLGLFCLITGSLWSMQNIWL
jgi:hypothetical protein